MTRPRYVKDGVACLTCGVVRASLRQHLKFAHGMTVKEYRKRFPGAETASPSLRKAARATHEDRVIDDNNWPTIKRSSTCAKGHAMRGKNIYRSKDGGRHCRRCASERGRLRYLAKKEEILARNARWRQDNPEKLRAYRALYRERNREKIKARARLARQRKKEES